MTIQTRDNEILRYLGYHGQPADEATARLIDECRAELNEIAHPRYTWARFPLRFEAFDQLMIGALHARSRNLGKNLLDCEEVALFAATLGIEADRLINRYSRFQISKGVVMQAVAASAIECSCDAFQSEIGRALQDEGLFMRPRFSPGYGDFSIAHQAILLRMLEAEKRIGLTLSESGFLVPIKSVTAVIGLSATARSCVLSGCENCSKLDCLYRRSSG